MAVRTPEHIVCYGVYSTTASIYLCARALRGRRRPTTRRTVRETMGQASMRWSSATARWRRSRNARDAASKASHWAALAGNARARIGRAPA